MRRMPEGLRLVGSETISFLDRICPYEPTRMPARSFRPAEEYVASLGHLLRARIATNLWIREAAFELDLKELFLAGSDEDLAAVVELLGDRRPGSVLPERLTFVYRDLELDTDLPAYDPHGLSHLSGEQLEDLLAVDAAGARIMAHHAVLLDTAFATFFAGWSGLALRVVPSYEFRPLGLGYDHGMPGEADRRSTVETGPSGRGRLPTAMDKGATGAARLDDRALRDWLAVHVEHGAVAVRDADFSGRHPWILIAHDQRSAMPIDHDPAGWRLGVPRPIGAGDFDKLTSDDARTVRDVARL